MHMSFTELRKHLEYDCKENRTCRPCNKEFQSIEEHQNHVKYSCQSVLIECSECDTLMARRDFQLHDCYCFMEYKKQEILDVLQKQSQQQKNSERDIVELQIRAENKKLVKEIEGLREFKMKKLAEIYEAQCTDKKLQEMHKKEIA